MNKTLLFIDEEQFESSLSLLEAADRLYDSECSEVYAVSLNRAGELEKANADYLITVMDKRFKYYDIVNLTNCLEELQMQYGFDCIMIPATVTGRLLAPRLSMRLGVGLVADVTDIRRKGSGIEMVRPAFDGKLLAGIVCEKTRPIMMSVRPGAFTYLPEQKLKKDKKLLFYYPDCYQKPGIQLLNRKPKPEIKDIRESQILVSGGGGVRERFEKLELLADALGGMVSASRSIIDSGAADRRIQVGQSGKTVSPKLYMAIGIYGALQHIQGLKDISYIISVNTDKDAPICSLSDVVVEGEALDFVEKLIARIQENNES